MTLTYDQPLITITAYAAAIGKSRKTVTRMIDDGRLPDARKIDGVWSIPADAVPLDAPSTNAVTSFEQHQPFERMPTVLEVLDQAPVFLTLEDAATLLGIPEGALRRNREYFGLVPFGPHGSLVMPQATIRGLRG
jgi:hypothetical protein